MLTMDHFCVAMDEKIDISGDISVFSNREYGCTGHPVYYYNNGTPVIIGGVDEVAVDDFNSLDDSVKLEVFVSMYKDSEERINKLNLGKIIWQQYLFKALKAASRDLDIDDTNKALECVRAWIDAHDNEG